MDQIDPVDWLREFLVQYRRLHSELAPEERTRREFSLRDLTKIGEIHWIRFVKPSIQILVVRHLIEETTDILYVYEPIPYSEAPEQLEEILSLPPFQRQLTPEESERFCVTKEEAIFRTIVEGFLLNVFNHPPSLATISSLQEPTVTQMGTLGGSNFAWLIIGDLLELPPAQAAEKVFPPSPVHKEKQVQDSKTEQDQVPIIQAYGTYFHPPVWIDDSTRETFKDKTAFGLMQRGRQVVLSTKYRGQPLLVTTAGFVGVVCETREAACQLLNELMLGAIFEGMSAHIVHPREIGNIEVDLHNGAITRTHLELVSPRTRQIPHVESEMPFFLSLYCQRIEIGLLERALATAEAFTQVIPYEWVSLFVAGYTHYENLEYTQSFLMLWLIVEQHIHELWGNLVSSLPKRRKGKFLSSPSYWSVDHSIELLNLMNRLSQSDYNELMTFKKKRNDIVHNIQFAGKQDAESLLDFVAGLFRSRLLQTSSMKKGPCR